MAHKKGQGTSRNGRDSNAQRLGFKAFGGQLVPGGTIIIRQRGTRVKPGLNVGRGKDDTLFAKTTGRIKFVDKGSMGKFVMVEAEAIKAAEFSTQLKFRLQPTCGTMKKVVGAPMSGSKFGDSESPCLPGEPEGWRELQERPRKALD